MHLREAGRGAILAVLILVALGSMVILGKRLHRKRTEPTWQAQLDWYVTLLNQDDGRIVSVEWVSAARFPEQFTAEMSAYTWSTSDTFHTAYTAAQHPEASLRPLPFPPTALWCIGLTHHYTTDPALDVPDEYEIVVLARHEEGRQAAWVMHQLTAPKRISARRALLEQLGCALQTD